MSDARDPLELPEYIPGAAVVLDDETRWPAMTPAERTQLDAMLHHRHEPRWLHRTGHR